MYRIMVDLETLATDDNATIISIGAVEFDMEGVKREFYQAVRADGQDKWGRTTDEDTVAWWGQQGEEARKVLNDPTAIQLDAALEAFKIWIGGRPVDELWGNGYDFDGVVLKNAYKAVGIEQPWGFRAARCYRTLKNLGIPLQPGDGIARTTKHNALDDAKVQAYYTIAYLREIRFSQNIAKDFQR